MAGTISILDNAPRLVIAETGEISVTIASTQGPAGPGTAPEGTAIKSTGETGGTKFLREDGDGTCSWQEITVGGDLLAANNLSDLASASAARTNLGLATVAATGDYDDLSNKPTIPSAARRGIFLAGTIEAAGEYHAVAESDVTLAAWQLTSGDGTSGSVTLDVWVTTDGSTPTNANSITNGNEPALSSDDFATGTTSGFSTTSISRGDRFVVKVDSLTTITEIYFSLTG